MDSILVGILIFPDVEILDFCGPYEVLASVRLDESRRRELPSPFRVVLIAETLEPVAAKGGLRVLPDATCAECPPLDWLIVPGGWGVRREFHNQRLIDWIAVRAQTASVVASVCTGAMLLGRAGLLEGRRATTHISTLDWMREAFPGVTVMEDLRWVEDGKVITSAGVSAGIDLSLHLVEKTFGGQIARATADHMEYNRLAGNRRRIS
jgi:transcriptional regulator GlxA family with amidase domain